MPSLRERVEDIRPLAEYFLGEFCARNNFRPKTFEPDAIEALEHHGWPGKVRELRNVVSAWPPRARRRHRSRFRPLRDSFHPEPSAAKQPARNQGPAERDHILRALQDSDWNVSGAARALGMERDELHKRIRALGIERDR